MTLKMRFGGRRKGPDPLGCRFEDKPNMAAIEAAVSMARLASLLTMAYPALAPFFNRLPISGAAFFPRLFSGR
jgi:hypothetical protein